MKTVYYTVGLPASGKSTWAKKKMEELGSGNVKRVNKDLLRNLLDNSKWSKRNEDFVLSTRDFIIEEALRRGLHVIVDDTGFSKKHESRIRDIASRNNAAFERVDFTDVPLEVCIERDQHRQDYATEKVIRDMHNQFLAVKVEPPPFDPALPDCVICDIDGTVSQMNGRGPYEFDKVGEDLPRMPIIETVLALSENKLLIFVSGREEIYRTITQTWLNTHAGTKWNSLYMRPAGDKRKDQIVKKELYEKHIMGKFNIAAIFEDRPRMLRMWREELGLGDRIFNVGDGVEF